MLKLSFFPASLSVIIGPPRCPGLGGHGGRHLSGFTFCSNLSVSSFSEEGRRLAQHFGGAARCQVAKCLSTSKAGDQ